MRKFAIILSLFFAACGTRDRNTATVVEVAENTEPANNFEYRLEKGKVLMFMELPIGADTLSCCFDTGGIGLVLDSLAATSLFDLDSLGKNVLMTKQTVALPHFSEIYKLDRYFHKVDIPFCGDTLHYDWFYLFPGMNARLGLDGLLSIPRYDRHIWSFNFEKSIIRICHPEDSVQVAELIPENYDFSLDAEYI